MVSCCPVRVSITRNTAGNLIRAVSEGRKQLTASSFRLQVHSSAHVLKSTRVYLRDEAKSCVGLMLMLLEEMYVESYVAGDSDELGSGMFGASADAFSALPFILCLLCAVEPELTLTHATPCYANVSLISAAVMLPCLSLVCQEIPAPYVVMKQLCFESRCHTMPINTALRW